MKQYQKGQSSVEFIVLAFVLVPLIIIVPLLGKYIDLAQTTTVASRYVAFEGTVHHDASAEVVGKWKSDTQLAAEVRRRFYSRNDVGVNTNDQAGEFDADRNPLWVDHRGSHLLPEFSRVAVQTQRNSLIQPLAAKHSDDFGLGQNNLYTGTVGVNVANVPNIGGWFDQSADANGVGVFDNLNLQINRSTTVLVNPWTALSSEEVESKVQDAGFEVYPIEPVEVFNAVLTLPIYAVETVFGGASPPDVGSIYPNVVPADRLQPY